MYFAVSGYQVVCHRSVSSPTVFSLRVEGCNGDGWSLDTPSVLFVSEDHHLLGLVPGDCWEPKEEKKNNKKKCLCQGPRDVTNIAVTKFSMVLAFLLYYFHGILGSVL